MNIEPIVIKKSMKETIKIPLLAFVMTCASVGCLFIDLPEYGTMGALARLLESVKLGGLAVFADRAFAIFGALFFGACFVITLKGIGSKDPVLIVDEQGITDRSTASSPGFIPWKDIKNISSLKTNGVSVISVSLNNEEAYMEKISAKNRLLRLLIKANKMLGYKAVLISLQGTGKRPGALVPRIKEIQRLVNEKNEQQ